MDTKCLHMHSCCLSTTVYSSALCQFVITSIATATQRLLLRYFIKPASSASIFCILSTWSKLQGVPSSGSTQSLDGGLSFSCAPVYPCTLHGHGQGPCCTWYFACVRAAQPRRSCKFLISQRACTIFVLSVVLSLAASPSDACSPHVGVTS